MVRSQVTYEGSHFGMIVGKGKLSLLTPSTRWICSSLKNAPDEIGVDLSIKSNQIKFICHKFSTQYNNS